LGNDDRNGSSVGVYLTGGISAYVAISNYLVQRCRLGGINFDSSCTNWVFVENVIEGSIYNINNPVSNCYFYNNIIESSTYYGWNGFTSSIFKNNIFLYQYNPGYYPIKASNSTFENNIFNGWAYSFSGVTNSAINNNLFVEPTSLGNCSECWGSDNIFGQDQSTIFVNQTGNTFDYSHDYHLQPNSPGKNAGKDGTDIGIYGGAFPWKAGSVPTNPHIQYESVSGVGEDGNIHVVVKVAAQDR